MAQQHPLDGELAAAALVGDVHWRIFDHFCPCWREARAEQPLLRGADQSQLPWASWCPSCLAAGREGNGFWQSPGFVPWWAARALPEVGRKQLTQSSCPSRSLALPEAGRFPGLCHLSARSQQCDLPWHVSQEQQQPGWSWAALWGRTGSTHSIFCSCLVPARAVGALGCCSDQCLAHGNQRRCPGWVELSPFRA